MEPAQGDAAADHRLALGVALGRDVGRVQELLVAQPAQRLPPWLGGARRVATAEEQGDG